jgi:hypothetical protein
MSSFKSSIIAVWVAVLAGACDRQHASGSAPSGIEIVLQDVLAGTSASGSPGGFTIRGLDSDLLVAVSGAEARAAQGRPSGVIQRRLPPGLYSVALDGTSSAVTAKPEIVLVTPARLTTVRVQSADSELARACNTM